MKPLSDKVMFDLQWRRTVPTITIMGEYTIDADSMDYILDTIEEPTDVFLRRLHRVFIEILMERLP